MGFGRTSSAWCIVLAIAFAAWSWDPAIGPQPALADDLETGDRHLIAEPQRAWSPPVWQIPPQSGQELRRLEARLKEACGAGDWEQAAAAAEELAVFCDLFFGPQDWRSVHAGQLRRQLQRARFLSESEREQIQEAFRLNQEANLQHLNGKWDQAREMALKAAEILKRLLGPCSPSHLESLQLLSGIAFAARQFPDAEQHMLELLAGCRQVYGIDSPPYAETEANLAMVWVFAGNYARAEDLIRHAAEIQNKHNGENSAQHAEVMSKLALLHLRQRDYSKAESLLRTLCKTCERCGQTLTPLYAACLQNLALCCQRQGKSAEAVPLYREVIQLNEMHIGVRRADLVNSLRDLVAMLKQQDKLEEAREHERRLEQLLNEGKAEDQAAPPAKPSEEE